MPRTQHHPRITTQLTITGRAKKEENVPGGKWKEAVNKNNPPPETVMLDSGKNSHQDV